MNYRKLEHPSRKICRYFLKNEYIFDEDECWYNHMVNRQEVTDWLNNFTCNECEDAFKSKTVMMQHKKIYHIEMVPKCRDFLQGKCKLAENTCCSCMQMRSMIMIKWKLMNQ